MRQDNVLGKPRHGSRSGRHAGVTGLGGAPNSIVKSSPSNAKLDDLRRRLAIKREHRGNVHGAMSRLSCVGAWFRR